MIDMDKKEQILHYHRVDGFSLREIARRTGLNRKTVTRYIREYEAQVKADPEEGAGMCLASKPKYAVRIQISVAIITYCLVAIVQHDMRLERSTYEVLQILSISLTDKTHLRDLFDKTNFNDVKDQFGPLIPGVFD